MQKVTGDVLGCWLPCTYRGAAPPGGLRVGCGAAGSSPGARNNKQQLCWWCLVPDQGHGDISVGRSRGTELAGSFVPSLFCWAAAVP